MLSFLAAADHAIGVISANPGSFRAIAEDVRHYIVPRFPYTIYFRVHPDRIRILAFKHHSRHPDYWRKRVED